MMFDKILRKYPSHHGEISVMDGQESPMLHTKFHGNQPAGSREEEF